MASNRKMSAGEIFRRYVFMVVGLSIMALGIAFSIKCKLGTSPISSPPYVISLFVPLTVGNITIIMHCILILIQILIYRSKYDPQQLLQLPIGILFGYLIDAGIWITTPMPLATSYPLQLFYCVLGIIGVGIGVGFEVVSKVAILAGEGCVLAIHHGLLHDKFEFRTVKISFDVTLVVIAIITSFAFLQSLQGVREGTVAAALFVGAVSKIAIKFLKPFENKYLYATPPVEAFQKN